VTLRIDSTITNCDFELSIVSPSLIPRVNDNPVILSIFGSVSNNFNGMSSKGFSCGVFVNSSLVGNEIFINGEGGGHWSVGD